MNLSIEYRPLDELVPDERNPKSHDLPALRASFARFGFGVGVVIDGRTGKLAAGHGRVEALSAMRAAGEAPPPGVTVAADSWLVPVQTGWASRDDAEAGAFLIAANRATELGGWDDAALASVLTSLRGDFDGLGYTDADLDDLLAVHEEESVLAPGPSDAHYADMPDLPEPGPTREAQGLREFVLIYRAVEYRELESILASLRSRYEEEATPVVVLRALRDARSLPCS